MVYAVSPRAVELAAGVVHLLGFAAAYGMCLCVTFVSSYVLAGGYGQATVRGGTEKRMLANYISVEVFLGYNLLVSLLMVLFNLLYLEPRATKVDNTGICGDDCEDEVGKGRRARKREYRPVVQTPPRRLLFPRKGEEERLLSLNLAVNRQLTVQPYRPMVQTPPRLLL
ncbi:hypothetical protein RHSIM_Rhsim11G0053700 [Rhododendron simsii]|uniref:Uncharacterized protein n=1 Tax=Rhododendron simsii TaxID=118357 RepID=A0A834GAH7_RHOSS|nr:hypothetical protein RHSIM_Rhsim11G0053700 [Rhododendron simsii]